MKTMKTNIVIWHSVVVGFQTFEFKSCKYSSQYFNVSVWWLVSVYLSLKVLIYPDYMQKNKAETRTKGFLKICHPLASVLNYWILFWTSVGMFRNSYSPMIEHIWLDPDRYSNDQSSVSYN